MKTSWGLGLILLGMAGIVNAAEPADLSKDNLCQISTINALLAGRFEGICPCAELTRYGDTGLGTFEALDGEMVILDGSIYRLRSDGSVQVAGPMAMTPFANVTFLEPDQSFELQGTYSMEQLQKEINQRLVNRNIFYAIRVDGVFDSIKIRSIPKQSKPYPKLVEVVKHQSVFNLNTVKGTLVGFWCPEFVQAINIPGFHFHFLSDDRKHGGHVLDCCLKKGTVILDMTPMFSMQLPTNGFGNLDLSGSHSLELNAVEK